MRSMHDRPTPNQALATELLGEDVVEWARNLNTARPPWSYDLIADELTQRTDGRVQVSREAIRRWLAEAEQAAS